MVLLRGRRGNFELKRKFFEEAYLQIVCEHGQLRRLEAASGSSCLPEFFGPFLGFLRRKEKTKKVRAKCSEQWCSWRKKNHKFGNANKENELLNGRKRSQKADERAISGGPGDNGPEFCSRGPDGIRLFVSHQCSLRMHYLIGFQWDDGPGEEGPKRFMDH